MLQNTHLYFRANFYWSNSIKKNFLLLQFANISKDLSNFEVATSEKFNLIVCEFKLKHA